MKYSEDGSRHPTVTDTGIYGFFDEYRFLSNFHECFLVDDEIMYPSSEHAYMARKTLDRDLKFEIAKLPHPSVARKFGKNLILRPDWEFYRVLAMRSVVWNKFSQNSVLKDKLLATGNLYLEETNDWNDKFWGADQFGNGLNMLGKCLMDVRTTLKQLQVV